MIKCTAEPVMLLTDVRFKHIANTLRRIYVWENYPHGLSLLLPFSEMVIVWRLRGNIIRTALCWVV